MKRQVTTVKTMSGFSITATTAKLLTMQNGRFYSPDIDALYEEVNQDNLDTVDAHILMSKLFKIPNARSLFREFLHMDQTNRDNSSATIRKYTKDYRNIGMCVTFRPWDHMAFISLIAILVEDNRGTYNKEPLKTSIAIDVPDSKKWSSRTEDRYLATWLRTVGWKDFLQQVWLVYGDIRKYDPVTHLDKKIPAIKVKLGY